MRHWTMQQRREEETTPRGSEVVREGFLGHTSLEILSVQYCPKQVPFFFREISSKQGHFLKDLKEFLRTHPFRIIV